MDNEQPETQVPEINAQELKEMLQSPEPPFLLDIREDWEVTSGIIPGATHIPMNSVPDRMDELPRGQTMVIYCAAGARSYAVAEYLLYQGFKNVINLDGGIMSWAELESRRK